MAFSFQITDRLFSTWKSRRPNNEGRLAGRRIWGLRLIIGGRAANSHFPSVLKACNGIKVTTANLLRPQPWSNFVQAGDATRGKHTDICKEREALGIRKSGDLRRTTGSPISFVIVGFSAYVHIVSGVLVSSDESTPKVLELHRDVCGWAGRTNVVHFLRVKLLSLCSCGCAMLRDISVVHVIRSLTLGCL